MAHSKDKKEKSHKKDKVEKSEKKSTLAPSAPLDPKISSLFSNSVCHHENAPFKSPCTDLSSLVPLSPSTPNSHLNPPDPPRKHSRTTKRKEMTTTKNSRNLTMTSWTLLTQTRMIQSPK